MFMGNVEASVLTAEALIAAFEAANPDIKIDLDSSGPQGTDGDNLVKTKLATGEMEDLLCTTPARCSRRSIPTSRSST